MNEFTAKISSLIFVIFASFFMMLYDGVALINIYGNDYTYSSAKTLLRISVASGGLATLFIIAAMFNIIAVRIMVVRAIKMMSSDVGNNLNTREFIYVTVIASFVCTAASITLVLCSCSLHNFAGNYFFLIYLYILCGETL